MGIKTRLFIISDTHGGVFDVNDAQRAHVVIHCGDLNKESKIDEYRNTLDLLRRVPTPLKLIISGNHDLTLDEPTFRKQLSKTTQPIEPGLVKSKFEDYGEPRRLFDEVREAGIVLLDERNYEFALQDGALLRVYASPFTPSRGG
ncbi:hypothetical protein TruAng_005638 [Truncatella angustata]|nr:hypothetical protein TruAng_005638 [Truncatella angustata]